MRHLREGTKVTRVHENHWSKERTEAIMCMSNMYVHIVYTQYLAGVSSLFNFVEKVRGCCVLKTWKNG